MILHYRLWILNSSEKFFHEILPLTQIKIYGWIFTLFFNEGTDIHAKNYQLALIKTKREHGIFNSVTKKVQMRILEHGVQASIL